MGNKTDSGDFIFKQQARTWLLTLNNPLEHEFSLQKIKEVLDKPFKKGYLQYWAYINEVSVKTNEKTGKKTPHCHILLYFPSKRSGGYIKKRFPTANLEICSGTVLNVLKYMKKDTSGEWYKKNPEKLAEKLSEDEANFKEFGVLPQGNKGRIKCDANALVMAIKKGMSDSELIDLDPTNYNRLLHIQRTRNAFLSEKYKNEYRHLDVTYIEGESRTGKTRYVMELTKYEAYTVSNYDNPFDSYSSQDVLFLDEFRSQITLSQILHWLDGYPKTLKARYNDKVACFTKVYIASNWKFEMQYKYEQANFPQDYNAFLKRINHKMTFNSDGSVIKYDNKNGVWIEDKNFILRKDF